MGGPKKKKIFQDTIGMPRESARGQCALAAEPAFARPFCLADSFGSVFPQGPGDGSGPEGQLAGVRVRRQQGRLMSGEL